MTGELFLGIIVGLVLSFLGGWVLARFTVSMQQKHNKKVITRFCVDAIRNIQGIIEEMDTNRDRNRAIHHDYLALIDIEVGIYGRNRELLILLPDRERADVRKFMNEIAIKRVRVMEGLDQFYRHINLADQIRAEGRATEAARTEQQALVPLGAAQTAADRLVTLASNANDLVNRLSALK